MLQIGVVLTGMLRGIGEYVAAKFFPSIWCADFAGEFFNQLIGVGA